MGWATEEQLQQWGEFLEQSDFGADMQMFKNANEALPTDDLTTYGHLAALRDTTNWGFNGRPDVGGVNLNPGIENFPIAMDFGANWGRQAMHLGGRGRGAALHNRQL
jgi:hypothetical protein